MINGLQEYGVELFPVDEEFCSSLECFLGKDYVITKTCHYDVAAQVLVRVKGGQSQQFDLEIETETPLFPFICQYFHGYIGEIPGWAPAYLKSSDNGDDYLIVRALHPSNTFGFDNELDQFDILAVSSAIIKKSDMDKAVQYFQERFVEATAQMICETIWTPKIAVKVFDYMKLDPTINAYLNCKSIQEQIEEKPAAISPQQKPKVF